MDASKSTVAQGYDQSADQYQAWVKTQTYPRESYTEKVLKNAPASPRILELGCASGIPITRMLLDRGAKVVANDISSKHIEMAQASCSEATLIGGDMTKLDLEPASFDGAVSFFAILHLPRAEQKGMFLKIHSWLKPGALFAFNLAAVDQKEIRGEFFGQEMFWSSYGVEESKAMVKEAGFEVLEADVLEAGDGKLEEDDPDKGVEFLWMVVRQGEGK